MAKVVRGMFGADGQPMVGRSKNMLGIVDGEIGVSATGVGPGSGGMSVAPRLVDLPRHRLPRRLAAALGVPATGNDKLRIWSLGAGEFQRGALTSDLDLRPDPDRQAHGFVEPARPMTLAAYEAALGATRPDWTLDEVTS